MKTKLVLATLLFASSCLAQIATNIVTVFYIDKIIMAGPTLTPLFVRFAHISAPTTSTVTISAFNCAGGNYLLVDILDSPDSLSISSVTANGVPMSLVNSTNIFTAAGNVWRYGLANPTTGDIVVTLSGAAAQLAATATFYSGVVSVGTTGIDYSTASRSGTTNGIVGTLPTDLVADVLVVNGATSTVTANSSQTINASKLNPINRFLSSSPGAPGTTIMGWQITSSPAACTWMGTVLHGL